MMRVYLKRFGYDVSKPAIERRYILKKVKKRHGFSYLLKALEKKIEKTHKKKISERLILKNDLKWARKSFNKRTKSSKQVKKFIFC